ncbi:MAG: RdgB/HAM1 family non-canonical purine NTP pyrophosphatase [Actinomycetota bacterium]
MSGDDRAGGRTPDVTEPFVVVCASANPGKVAEIQELLAGVVDLRPRPDEVPDVVEDADTLVGNARLKAVAIAEATGLPAVADDTGLEVDALDGRPGVYTARYAGEGCTPADNRAKMLDELSGVPADQRGAAFRTVALVRWPDGREVAVEGVCRGSITTAERGDGGFGYDPIFVPAEAGGRTFAEMPSDEKHAISHRGLAFRALLAALAGEEPGDASGAGGPS